MGRYLASQQPGVDDHACLDLPCYGARLRGAGRIWRRLYGRAKSRPVRKPGGKLGIRAWGVRVVHYPLRPLPVGRRLCTTTDAVSSLLANGSAGSPRDAVMSRRSRRRSGRTSRPPARQAKPPESPPRRWWNRITKTILGAGALATAIAAVLALVVHLLPSQAQQNVARFISVQVLGQVPLSQYQQRSMVIQTQSADRPMKQGLQLAVAVSGPTSPALIRGGATAPPPPPPSAPVLPPSPSAPVLPPSPSAPVLPPSPSATVPPPSPSVTVPPPSPPPTGTAPSSGTASPTGTAPPKGRASQFENQVASPSGLVAPSFSRVRSSGHRLFS